MNLKDFEIELKEILSWWDKHMIDEEKGGFYGRVDGHGRLDSNADKGIILNTRILWTFAAAANKMNDSSYRLIADRAFDYILSNFLDPKINRFNYREKF